MLLALSVQTYAWDWWPLPMAEPDHARDSLFYAGGISLVTSSGTNAPSLFWYNAHGEISPLPHSGNIHAGIVKPATRPNRWFDYDFGVVLSGRIAGSHLNADPRQLSGTGYFSLLYAHARLYIVDITAGIQPEYYGAGDEALTNGCLLFSGNAHPIPRISIGFERWTPIPGLFGYVEVKGGLTHKWAGDNAETVNGTMIHHKYIGGRVGGKLPVNISYAFHHAVQWGGYSTIYGDLGNDWNAYKAALFARSGGSMMNDQFNAQGNHIAFQQLALDVKGEGWKVTAYWQCMNEDGPIRLIGFGMNNKDGLWGISATQNRWPFIQGFTYEFINTTDQSGPLHDKDGCIYGGADDYYTNSVYRQGWTYYGRIIGSPLLSLDNTRVMAHHVGVRGDIYGFRYRAVCTYTDNYGNYDALNRTHNTAVLLEVKKTVPQAWDLEFGAALGGDFGTQFGNSFGAMITVTKKGLIKEW